MQYLAITLIVISSLAALTAAIVYILNSYIARKILRIRMEHARVNPHKQALFQCNEKIEFAKGSNNGKCYVHNPGKYSEDHSTLRLYDPLPPSRRNKEKLGELETNLEKIRILENSISSLRKDQEQLENLLNDLEKKRLIKRKLHSSQRDFRNKLITEHDIILINSRLLGKTKQKNLSNEDEALSHYINSSLPLSKSVVFRRAFKKA